MGLSMMLAGARLIDADAVELIRETRRERGVLPCPTSEAQIALAAWMLGECANDGDIAVSRMLGAFTDDQIARFLTGETEPEPSAANHIAERTEGAVLPGMWARGVKMPEDPVQIGRAGAPKAAERTRPKHVSLTIGVADMRIPWSVAQRAYDDLGAALGFAGGGQGR